MKWETRATGSYEYVHVVEAKPRPGSKLPRLVCVVYSPVGSSYEPTDEHRAEMFATAQEIVEAHNAKEK